MHNHHATDIARLQATQPFASICCSLRLDCIACSVRKPFSQLYYYLAPLLSGFLEQGWYDIISAVKNYLS
jgi:hypothetical protein